MLSKRFLLSLSSLVVLVACSGSADTDERTNEAVYPTCTETRTPLGPGDETPLGITAREAFEFAKGTHEATLHYKRGGSETALTLLVEGEPRAIELVQREHAPIEKGRPVFDIAIECNDTVEAKLDLRFETEDGAFHESWEKVRFVRSVEPAKAELSAFHSIDIEALEGSYVPDELAPTDYDRIVQGSVSMSLHDSGRFEGRIGYVAEKTSGEGKEGTVSATLVTVATWDSPGQDG